MSPLSPIAALVTTTALAALCVTLLTPWVRRLALHWGAVDHPGGRRIHRAPTARLGGLGVTLGLGIAVGVGSHWLDPSALQFPERFFLIPGLLALAGGVLLVGAYDDLRGISPPVKLAALTVAALGVVLLGLRIEYLHVPGLGPLQLGWLSIPLTLFWIVGIANAVNLIDGIDGAASGVSAVSSLILAGIAFGCGAHALALVFAALAGASSGFLFHNREPARIFLGDSGSLTIGFLIASLSVAGCTAPDTALLLPATALALAVPALDTAQAIRRRVGRALRARRGNPMARAVLALREIARADSEHLHHRLLRSGLSHRQATRVLVLVSLAAGLAAWSALPEGTATAAERLTAISFAGLLLFRLGALPATHHGLDPATAIGPKALPKIVLPSRAPRDPATGSEELLPLPAVDRQSRIPAKARPPLSHSNAS